MNKMKEELYRLITQDSAVFDFIQKNTLDGLWYWNLENREEVWINDKFWETLGYESEERPQKITDLIALVHPEDLKMAKEKFAKHLLHPNFPVEQIIQYSHKDGSKVWLKVKGQIIRNEEGQPTRMLGMHINITDEKRIEKLMTETNRTARLGSYELNIVKNETYLSPISLEILEFPDDFNLTVEGGIALFKEGDNRKTIEKFTLRAIQEGLPFETELQLINAHGREIWVRVTGQAEVHEGTPIRMYGTFQDIDERKKLELEHQTVSKRLKLATEGARIGVYDFEIPTGFLIWDDQMYKLHGVTREKFPNPVEAWAASIHPDDKEQLVASTNVAITNAQEFSLEYRIIRPSGEVRHLQSQSTILNNPDGKSTRSMGGAWDTTKQKMANEKVKQLAILDSKRKEMEQITFAASHDLREPLLTIRGFTDLLNEEFKEVISNDIQEILQQMTKAIDNMDALIHGLLTYSQLSVVKSSEKIAIAEVIQSVQSDLKASINQRQAIFEVGKMPTVQGYPLELKLLFQNLISNALKFSKADVPPFISITSKKLLNGWEFLIADNGIGIDESYKEKIFLLFSRLHSKSDYSGTGIGLANCKKIVEMHNGKIWVTDNPGGGSRFYFTILLEE